MKVIGAPEYAAQYEFGVYEKIGEDEYEWVASCANGFKAEQIAKEECINPVIFHNVRIQGIKVSD